VPRAARRPFALGRGERLRERVATSIFPPVAAAGTRLGKGPRQIRDEVMT
jgi:hypothetical protein